MNVSRVLATNQQPAVWSNLARAALLMSAPVTAVTQLSTVQYSTVQYSTVQYSSGPHVRTGDSSDTAPLDQGKN